MKLCKKCNTTKEFLEFSKKKSNKDGLNSWCKECNKEYLRNYYLENKELYSDRSKEYYELNSNTIKENSKKWREGNIEYIKEYHKKYYSENKEELLEYKKDHYLNNKDIYLERSKDQKDSNPVEYSNYLKNWRKSNPEYMKDYWKDNKISKQRYDYNYITKYPHVVAWRSSLKSALTRIGSSKESTTIDMLKYSANDLRSHLELLFLDGMSWKNWGEWHIDHKIPVSKFEPNTPIHIVNSLDNLQPLWAFDNLSKNNRS
jgi:hypothetical protein